MSEPLNLLSQTLGIQPLDGLDDPDVERSPSVLQHACVDDLVCERMLEGVLEVRKEARLVEELGSLEVHEAPAEIILWQVCHGEQKGERNILPDDRGRSEERRVGK